MVDGIVRTTRFTRFLAASVVLVVAAIGASPSAASGSQAGRTQATYDQVHSWAKHYAASHPGKDRDINATRAFRFKSRDQILLGNDHSATGDEDMARRVGRLNAIQPQFGMR